MTETTAVQSSESTVPTWMWIAVSLSAHAAWGIYPVLARYLQTVSDLPTFSILSLANLIVLILLGKYLLSQTSREILKMRIIWVFALIVIVRAISNIASTRFTLSIYIQLVTQGTPFLVILFSTLLFREKLPRFTIQAITMALVGALMMIGSNFGDVVNDPNRRDWLGVGLALLSITALSLYMVLVRRSVKHHITPESLLLIQLIAITVVSGITSMIFSEDWSRYTQIGWTDWMVFFSFTFLVFFGANIGQIQAIRHIGAPFHSSMLASRLISALIFGALLLGERLESIWQLIGAAIVFVTITWFLWQQR